MLPNPTTKLNELDHLIVYRLAIERGSGADISEIRAAIEFLFHKHNIQFKRSKMQIPTWAYFYTRLERLVLLQYVDKVGKKAYRLNWEYRNEIIDYIKPYIKVNYNLEDEQ